MSVVEQVDADQGVGEVRKFFRQMHPREMLALGNGTPVVVKQLLQGFFLLLWPFWVVTLAVYGVLYYGILFPVLWVLFWPVRLIWGDKKSDSQSDSERPR